MNKYLVCAATGHFADDVPTTCTMCGAGLVRRPHAPADAVPICADCAADVFDAQPDAQVRVTEETKRELGLYYAKSKGGTQ